LPKSPHQRLTKSGCPLSWDSLTVISATGYWTLPSITADAGDRFIRGLLGRFAKKWSAGDTMFGVVDLDAGVVLHPLIVLDQLGRDSIGQIGGYVINDSRSQVPDPHENLEISDC
jgi:hypothetical protein